MLRPWRTIKLSIIRGAPARKIGAAIADFLCRLDQEPTNRCCDEELGAVS